MLKKITTRHRRMMEALVFEALRPCEVAQRFNITESRLSIIRRTPLWQKEEDVLRAEAREISKTAITRLIPEALRCHEEILKHSDNEALRFKASVDILNRGRVTGDDAVVSNGATIRVVIDE